MNTPANREVSWLCPRCRAIPTEQVVIYNEALRVQQFEINPILPTCLTCGSEVALVGHPLDGNTHKFIVLTGTCASGKTTTAQALMADHGFAVIDGDCVMNVIRHKTGVRKVDSNGPSHARGDCLRNRYSARAREGHRAIARHPARRFTGLPADV